MIAFFKIGSTDVSPYMDYQNYEMNQESIYESWVDGYGVEHRNTYRTKVTGEFKLGFTSDSDLETFMNLLASNINTDGYYPVIAYVQNTGTSESFGAFITTEAEAKWDFTNSRVWHEVTCNVTQR